MFGPGRRSAWLGVLLVTVAWLAPGAWAGSASRCGIDGDGLVGDHNCVLVTLSRNAPTCVPDPTPGSQMVECSGLAWTATVTADDWVGPGGFHAWATANTYEEVSFCQPQETTQGWLAGGAATTLTVTCEPFRCHPDWPTWRIDCVEAVLVVETSGAGNPGRFYLSEAFNP